MVIPWVISRVRTLLSVRACVRRVLARAPCLDRVGVRVPVPKDTVRRPLSPTHDTYPGGKTPHVKRCVCVLRVYVRGARTPNRGTGHACGATRKRRTRHSATRDRVCVSRA
eukprot:7251637-Prymnesium_polylepis.1